jgi:hypothetical protein
VSRFGRAWRRLWRPTTGDTDQWSEGADHCPRCGQELPAVRPGNVFARVPSHWEPTDDELIQKCPFDGRSPFNDKAREMLSNGTLPLTRRTQ